MKRKIREVLTSYSVPGVQLVPSDTSTLTHFLGSPELPDGMNWPSRAGKPLDFLARVSLAELQRAASIPWLPSTGALLFFYDTDAMPWGFDPADGDGCALLHVPDLVTPRTSSNHGFRPISTFPGAEREVIAHLELSDDDWDDYEELREDAFADEPHHQMGGFPEAVQNDTMELECQLASNGLYCGNSSGYEDPRAERLKDGAKDWRLLLQVDSDDDLGFMWGDMGRIYFWVREPEARAGDFSGAWVVLQCS